ncbi:MAG: hypothetical protein K2X74_01425 [Acetobacteraceae bacterium]|nr:hypothetical protein [Acetobacteraceae bacterium]
MSGSSADFDLMGQINNSWGVCGFTSCFYAMYEMNPAQRGLLLGAGIATKVLAEIKTYLVMLQADGKTALLRSIEDYTKTFGKIGKCDFSTWTIDGYIALINTAVGKSDAEIRGDCSHSIGMPPEAVVDYLKRIWGRDSELQSVSGGTGGVADAIIGVTRGTMPMYDGLSHWMYRKGGKIYSWGREFPSIEAANKAYRLCRVITIK